MEICVWCVTLNRNIDQWRAAVDDIHMNDAQGVKIDDSERERAIAGHVDAMTAKREHDRVFHGVEGLP